MNNFETVILAIILAPFCKNHFTIQNHLLTLTGFLIV